jgi:hypothetical protein
MKKYFKTLYRWLHPSWQTVQIDFPVDMKPRFSLDGKGNEALSELMTAHTADIEAFAQAIASRAYDLQDIRLAVEEPDPTRPCWNNGFLPGLDVAALYTAPAYFKSKRYIEVGSGNSTQVIALSKRDHELDLHVTSIDPYPRVHIDELADAVIRSPYEETSQNWIESLEPGDIVFIDNSHRSFPNSDVTVFFTETLHRLPKGTIVHIHDIYLPWDYPQDMCDRSYNEQYLLATTLLSNPERYRIHMPAFWAHKQPEIAAIIAPVWEADHLDTVERHGGSFWFEIT